MTRRPESGLVLPPGGNFTSGFSHFSDHRKSEVCTGTAYNNNTAEQVEKHISSDLRGPEKDALFQTILGSTRVFGDSLGHIDVIQPRIDTGGALSICQYPPDDFLMPIQIAGHCYASTEGSPGRLQPIGLPWSILILY